MFVICVVIMALFTILATFVRINQGCHKSLPLGGQIVKHWGSTAPDRPEEIPTGDL